MVPVPYTIFGITLKSLSLGHIFLMQRFGCAFSSENPDTMGGIDDLILGISICSRTFDEFVSFIGDEKEFKRWTKQWGLAIRKQIKKTKNFELFSKFSLFKEYLKSGIVKVNFWELEESDVSEQSGTHWTHSVLNVLTSELGYTQSEALNVPVARALQDYYRYLEKNGAITIMSDEDMEASENAKKNQEKVGVA
jgi:hypothetical protein